MHLHYNDQLTSFTEIVAVYSETHTIHKNTLLLFTHMALTLTTMLQKG